jgi:PAS domain S-box-containing protein
MFVGNLDIIKVAYNTANDGIIIANSVAKIVFANKAIEKSLGYSSDELVGKDLNFFLPKSLHKIHRNHFKAYLADPHYLSFDNVKEIMGVHKNGKIVPLELKLSQFELDNLKFAQAIITDISKRKQEEKLNKIEKMKLKELVKDHNLELEDVVKKLRDTNQNLELEIKEKIEARQKARKALVKERELSQLKTRFLSMASHEFRTPLSGIMTSASLIDKYISKDNKNVVRHVNTIKSMVNHLGTILDDFLTLDRIETGEIHYKFTKFKFNELMQHIHKECKPLLKKGQIINYLPCEDCPTLYQDRKIIHVILTNIIFNAIKYSPENSRINISVESDDYVTIVVKDQGIGIPKDEQKNIFSKFFRASNTTQFQGTGIGLNIVQASVIGLGGSIDFTSEEGKGSSFIVRLPKNIAS